MNPPPLGEALSIGWERFKAQAMPLMLAVFLASLVMSVIPIAGVGLGMAGVLYAGLKALRGQTVEIGDAFIGFQRPMDHIMIGLWQIIGVLACCIGVMVTGPLFYQGHLLIIEKGMTWQQAKDTCMEHIKPNWLGWAIYGLVLGLVAQLGLVACIVGVFVTSAIQAVAMAYGYEQTLGKA